MISSQTIHWSIHHWCKIECIHTTVFTTVFWPLVNSKLTPTKNYFCFIGIVATVPPWGEIQCLLYAGCSSSAVGFRCQKDSKKTRTGDVVVPDSFGQVFFCWFWTIVDHIGQIWTNLDKFGPFWTFGLVYFDQYILTCIFGPDYLDLSIRTCQFGPVYLDLSFWIHLLGPAYLDLSIWTHLFGLFYLDYTMWTPLFGPL